MVTGRSHPPSLVTLVERALTKQADLPRPFRLAVGVSGGPDSMALCHALSLLRRKITFELLVVSLDHGLRAEAAQEVALVHEFCEQHGLPFEAKKLTLEPGANLQERARTERYRALWEVARRTWGPEVYLATAHHADDRAETVLLRLLRGTSLEGLSVLPVQSDFLLRPLAFARKSDVHLHLSRHGVPFCRDPSNDDPRYLRVRVRKELLPVLEELSPGIVSHLCHLAEEARGLQEPLGLNREQRMQLRKALQDPTVKVDLPLGAGLRLRRDRGAFRPK